MFPRALLWHSTGLMQMFCSSNASAEIAVAEHKQIFSCKAAFRHSAVTKQN